MAQKERKQLSGARPVLETDRECGTPRAFRTVCRSREIKADAVSYCTLFEENPLILFIVDPEGIVNRVNTFGAAQLGYAPAELTGKPIFLIFHRDDRSAVRLRLEESLRSPERITYWEFRKVCKNGDVMWVKEFARPITDASGAVRILISCADITTRKLAEEALLVSEEKYRELVELANSIILKTDAEGKIIFFNEFAQRFFGYAEEEVLGRSIAGTILPAGDEAQGGFPICIEEILKHPESTAVDERESMRKDGERVWVAWTHRVIRDGEGRFAGLLCVGHDIDGRVRAEEALKSANERLKSVLESITDAYLVLDEQWRFVEINPVAEKIFRRPARELLGKVAWKEFPESVGSDFYRNYHRAVEERRPVHFEACSPLSERWYEVHAYPREERLEIYMRTITGRKRMEEALRRQATQDSLTGLFNRTMFVDHLRLETAQARRDGKKVAVLFLDLDRFKNINDTLGHDTGDLLLKEVAVRLRRSVRESDTLARIGGDEFNVLLPGIAHAEDVVVTARKIIYSFREPYVIAGYTLSLSTSIGISIYPDDGESTEALLKNADIAMYHAKEKGGDTYQFYNPAMNARTLERIMLESSLHQALGRGELMVYYQPQIDMETRKMVGAEALVRWRHPELGVLDPSRFLDLAEETGYILAIGGWVLKEACAQGKAWQEKGFPALRITVNLSARQFQHPDMVEEISRIVHETGLNPHLLDLEITESVAMRNIDLTVRTLRWLREKGITFSIDDFGTGYSSFRYLKRLPIDTIKIDGSLIKGLVDDPDDKAIVNAVIAMAHNMKKKVIAEGVENESQLHYLHTRHCDEIQGHLVSRPLSADAFENLLFSHTAPFGPSFS
ncbi:MAG: EAL domain-containing protein [Thermodesulfovibrionales bacterium]